MKPYPPTVKNTTVLLQQIRQLMKTSGVDGYIIPSSDDHQTEYVAPWCKRRAFITGFTGSVGTAIITATKAALWVDGRYHDQADIEVDCNWIIQKQGLKGVPSQTKWMAQELKGKILGADPRVISLVYYEALMKQIGKSVSWKNVDKNLVDQVWTNRPNKTQNQIFIQPLKYSGQKYTEKIKNLRSTMESRNTAAIIVQALDDVAWLLNLRGNDIPYNPFFYAYVIVTRSNISLFTDMKKINASVKNHLCLKDMPANMCVNVRDYDYDLLGKIIQNLVNTNGTIWVPPKSSVFIGSKIPEEQRHVEYSPIQLPKARKNRVEIEGMKIANIKDGIAIMEYFVWLKKQIAEKKKVTEITGAEKLREFKSKQANYVSLSFGTISGFGANGAIIHYRADQHTDATITDKSLYLLDSGAQFHEGSTDITRTIHLGTPTEKQKEMYTYVLKGAIALARATFPFGTYGRNIDVYARQFLWNNGLNYRHGTGHGIGSFLSIHEGPGRINNGRTGLSESPLYKGMVFSDEPGYYQYGEYGIRLETAICVNEKETKYRMGNQSFLGFHLLTWVPFEKKLINIDMLTEVEIAWLNNYNKEIRHIMGTEFKKQGKTEVYNYMMELTEPFKKQQTSSAKMNSFSYVLVCLCLSVACFLEQATH